MWLAARTSGGTGTAGRRAVLLGITLLVFSPSQWANWLWGMQLIVFVPIACIAVALLAVTRLREPAWPGFVVAAVACDVATFSYANGALSWIVVGPAVVLFLGRSRRGRIWCAAVWAALFALHVAAYLHGYQQPEAHTPLGVALGRPLDTLLFWVTFLGQGLFANWTSRGILPAGVTGALLLLSLGACVGHLAVRRRRDLWEAATPWLCVAAYVLGSGALTALGRVSFGLEAATASRYATFSLYLPVALLPLGALICQDLAARRRDPDRPRTPSPRPRRFAWPLLALVPTAAVILLAYPLSAYFGWVFMIQSEFHRRSSRAQLHFIRQFPDERRLAEALYPRIGPLVRMSEGLDALGLLDPPLADSRRVAGPSEGDASAVGAMPTTAPGDAAVPRLAGRAWVADGAGRRPADGVVLARRSGDGSVTAISLAEMGLTRERWRDLLRATPADYAHWEADVDPALLGVADGELTVWAYDARRDAFSPVVGAAWVRPEVGP